MSHFIKIRLVGSELFHADGQTNLTKLLVVFLYFSNAHNNNNNNNNNNKSVSFQVRTYLLFATILSSLSTQCTRWFKYDRDKLWLVYTQIVPVIFEPPCTCISNIYFPTDYNMGFRNAVKKYAKTIRSSQKCVRVVAKDNVVFRVYPAFQCYARIYA